MSGHNDEFRPPHLPARQHTNEKFKKGRVTKLSHWKHDSTPSNRKPSLASPGGLHQSPEVSDTWAHCLNSSVVSQKSKSRTRQVYSANHLVRKVLSRVPCLAVLETARDNSPKQSELVMKCLLRMGRLLPYTITSINLGRSG